MPTIHREEGFRFLIWPNDHSPAHVHAHKAGVEVRVAIGDEDAPPWILSRRGMSDRDAVRAAMIVQRRQAQFLEAWRRIHEL